MLIHSVGVRPVWYSTASGMLPEAGTQGMPGATLGHIPGENAFSPETGGPL